MNNNEDVWTTNDEDWTTNDEDFEPLEDIQAETDSEPKTHSEPADAPKPKSDRAEKQQIKAEQVSSLTHTQIEKTLAGNSFNKGASTAEIQATYFELGLTNAQTEGMIRGTQRFLERTSYVPQIDVINFEEIASASDLYLENRIVSPELLLPPGKKNL